MQHRLYQVHKREKESRQRQIKFYQHMGMQVKAGSEDDITPEDKWISKFSNWELAEDQPGTSSSVPPPAAEESEEEEESESEEEYDE